MRCAWHTHMHTGPGEKNCSIVCAVGWVALTFFFWVKFNMNLWMLLELIICYFIYRTEGRKVRLKLLLQLHIPCPCPYYPVLDRPLMMSCLHFPWMTLKVICFVRKWADILHVISKYFFFKSFSVQNINCTKFWVDCKLLWTLDILMFRTSREVRKLCFVDVNIEWRSWL